MVSFVDDEAESITAQAAPATSSTNTPRRASPSHSVTQRGSESPHRAAAGAATPEAMEALRRCHVVAAAFCRSSQRIHRPTGAFFFEDKYGDHERVREEEEGVRSGAGSRSSIRQEKHYLDTLTRKLDRIVECVQPGHAPSVYPSRGAPSGAVFLSPAPLPHGLLTGPFSALGPATRSSGANSSGGNTSSGANLSSILDGTPASVEYCRFGVCDYGAGEIQDYHNALLCRAREGLKKVVASSSHRHVGAVMAALLDLSYFTEEEWSPPATTADDASAPVVEVASCRFPLRDPISQSLLSAPARGRRCAHFEVFDAEMFIRCYVEKRGAPSSSSVMRRGGGGAAGPCPICNKTLRLDDLRLDERVLRAMSDYCASSSGTALSPAHLLEWDVCSARSGGQKTPCRVIDPCVELSHVPQNGTPSAGTRRDRDDAGADESEEPGNPVKRRRVEFCGYVWYATEEKSGQ